MQSRLLLSLLLISAAGAASAQEISTRKERWPTHEKQFGITSLPGAVIADTTGDRLRQLQLLSKTKQAANLLANATYSHDTDKGKVYIMPHDNMRCLVPDPKKSAPMPTVRLSSADQMPNLYKVKPRP